MVATGGALDRLEEQQPAKTRPALMELAARLRPREQPAEHGGRGVDQPERRVTRLLPPEVQPLWDD